MFSLPEKNTLAKFICENHEGRSGLFISPLEFR